MKRVLTILGIVSVAFLFSACDNGGDDSPGGGVVRDVSFTVSGDTATCFGANKSTITGDFQTCEWYCATFMEYKNPMYWVLTFDHHPELRDKNVTADYSYKATAVGPCQ
ncbi:MAG: hypothetical protein CSA26_07605 [Desulfobacterales bacterium]|nr:MAG: hypothetical protein CSA26_07605 [Desulfobacterales bacterium]